MNKPEITYEYSNVQSRKDDQNPYYMIALNENVLFGLFVTDHACVLNLNWWINYN